MRHSLPSILAAAFVAAAAVPAVAGTVQVSAAQVGSVEITFDETGVPLGESFGTSYVASEGVRFDDLFADGEAAPGDGPYSGFAEYFSDSVVASNFAMGYIADAMAYENLEPGRIRTDTIDIDFVDPVDGVSPRTIFAVGFDYLAIPGNTIRLQLFSGGQTTGSAFDYATALLDPNDPNSLPEIGFAGLANDAGFDRLRIQILGSQPRYFSMNDLRFRPVVVPQTPTVPLPPAAWLGLALLAGVGVARRRRRRA